MVEIYRDTGTPRDTFKFTFSACPAFKLSFDLPVAVPAHNRPFKRRRALSDVDGDGNEGRKKRRLRLYLITSRLSRPFSQPASNIVNRGISKVPIWRGKNKTHGKSVLRKAAIMNRVRITMDAAKDFMRQEQEKSKARLELKDIFIQKPRLHNFSLLPSPLGLSNYDALDLEDDEEMYEEDHDGTERSSSIYSDFNIMNPITAGDGDDYEYLDALDGIVPEDLPDQPPPDPTEEGMAELLREKGCEGESFFVELRN